MKSIEHSPSDDPIIDWTNLNSLLVTGQYQQASELLHSAQSALQISGDAIFYEVMAAARQICLACLQSRAEMNWHRRAQLEAGEREHEMRHQLQSLLEMLSGNGAVDLGGGPQSPAPPPRSEHAVSEFDPISNKHGLAKIIQSLLNHLHLPTSEDQVDWPNPQTSDEISADRLRDKETPARRSGSDSPKGVDLEDEAAEALRVYCFGPFRVLCRSTLISNWQSLKGKSIFKYLVKHHHSPVSKEMLMEVFWPDTDPESSRRNLHQAIYNLRQTLRHGQPDFKAILFEDDHYLLNPDLSLWLDFEEFERGVIRGRRLELAGNIAGAIEEFQRAEALYLGDYLEDDLYEDWAASKREQLRTAYLDLADRLSVHYLNIGNTGSAIELCHKILEVDNCHEAAYRRLMQSYQAIGQSSLAVRHYHLCVEKLKTELDVTPSSETRTLFEAITRPGDSLSLAMRSR